MLPLPLTHPVHRSHCDYLPPGPRPTIEFTDKEILSIVIVGIIVILTIRIITKNQYKL